MRKKLISGAKILFAPEMFLFINKYLVFHFNFVCRFEKFHFLTIKNPLLTIIFFRVKYVRKLTKVKRRIIYGNAYRERNHHTVYPD